MQWYKHDVNAFLSGTRELTLEELGAYIRLIDYAYDRNGDVPNNDYLLSRVIGTQERRWNRIKARLIARGKIWIEDEQIQIKRVKNTIFEAKKFSENQSLRAKNRYESKGDRMRPRNAGKHANTLTKKDKSSFGSTSEQNTSVPPPVDNPAPPKRDSGWEPSAVLIAHESQKRPTPGSLATALVGSALARPAIAPTQPAGSSGGNLERPFSRAEVGKPSGWDFGPKQAANR